MSGTTVNTSTMKPAIPPKNGTAPVTTSVSSAGAKPPEDTPPPKPRRRKRKKEEPTPPPPSEPTSAQFEALGILTWEARQRGVSVEEYVAELRSTVDAYDAIFGK